MISDFWYLPPFPPPPPIQTLIYLSIKTFCCIKIDAGFAAIWFSQHAYDGQRESSDTRETTPNQKQSHALYRNFLVTRGSELYKENCYQLMHWFCCRPKEGCFGKIQNVFGPFVHKWIYHRQPSKKQLVCLFSSYNFSFQQSRYQFWKHCIIDKFPLQQCLTRNNEMQDVLKLSLYTLGIQLFECLLVL